MRALLNCLRGSSSLMLVCSSCSIILQVCFILTSLFIRLLWLASSLVYFTIGLLLCPQGNSKGLLQWVTPQGHCKGLLHRVTPKDQEFKNFVRLPFLDYCKANLSFITPPINQVNQWSIPAQNNQWCIPTHPPLAGAYGHTHIHMTFKIIVNLILFPSLMRALLSFLSCSSSSMMICSSHSNFLLIFFIMMSLFIRLLWLA